VAVLLTKLEIAEGCALDKMVNCEVGESREGSRDDEMKWSCDRVEGSRRWNGSLKRFENFEYGGTLTGGKVPYQKKCPDRKAIESKKTGCQCKIVIKCYPHTPIVRGRYEGDHNHEIGLSNIAFIRISSASREQIRKLLEQKVDPREIVCNS
jgi:hypothetical protein